MANPATVNLGKYDEVERRLLNFAVRFGPPGSRMQMFINKNQHQWNVKNWVEHATRNFCNTYTGASFTFRYTPKGALANLNSIQTRFMGMGKDFEGRDKNIEYPKDKNEDVFARIELEMRVDRDMVYNTFNVGGNFFFFGGDFEAEKVDDSDWYDVTNMDIKSLNFMDGLGRKYQVLPTI